LLGALLDLPRGGTLDPRAWVDLGLRTAGLPVAILVTAILALVFRPLGPGRSASVRCLGLAFAVAAAGLLAGRFGLPLVASALPEGYGPGGVSPFSGQPRESSCPTC